MRAAGGAAAAVVVAFLGGCVENTAPGNDREAGLDAPEPPAQLVTAAEALSGVAIGLLYPEIMPDHDLATVPVVEGACRFRFTVVGFPVLIYGGSAVVKLNGKLVPLPRTGEGTYASAGVEVRIRPLGEPDGGGGPFPAELVLRLPGAPNELGFHGVSACGPG